MGNRSLGGGYFAPQVFLVPGFATVGAVIVARRANTVGWLFVGLGLLAASHTVSMAYAERELLATVVRTMQPTAVSLWLRPSPQVPLLTQERAR